MENITLSCIDQFANFKKTIPLISSIERGLDSFFLYILEIFEFRKKFHPVLKG